MFNVGNYRRKIAGAEQPHQFFDHSQAQFNAVRHQAADEAMSDLLQWLDSGSRTNASGGYDSENAMECAAQGQAHSTADGSGGGGECPACTASAVQNQATTSSSGAVTRVAIYDATNSTLERRRWIRKRLEQHPTPVQARHLYSMYRTEMLMSIFNRYCSSSPYAPTRRLLAPTFAR